MRDSIMYKNIPCWYELYFEEKIPAIILRIHKEFIENLHFDLQNHYTMKTLMEKFNFSEFASDFNGDIGFNKVFKHQGEKDNFIEFLIKMPSSKKGIKRTCPFCNGSGYDKYLKKKCASCDGTSKKSIIDWDQVRAISASFTFFTNFLEFPEKETSASFSQLMTVRTVTAEGGQGGSLYGEISIPFKQWLMSLGDDEIDIPEVDNAMQIAYKKMFTLTDYEKNRFYTLKRGKGRFTTFCPGDACGLNPTDWSDDEGKGYRFSSNNTDDSLQQITLLVGLIKLYELVKKTICK